MSTNQNASNSTVSSLHKLPKWSSKEARAKKEVYVHANIARLRPSSSKVTEKAPRCSHGNAPILDCCDCFAESVRGLPSLPLSLVLKKLSTTDFIWWEGEDLHVIGPTFFKKERYAEHLQIAFARRLGVITILVIESCVLDSSGVATLITGNEILSLVRLVGPKKK